MSTVVVMRACPSHGPQAFWVDVPADLDNPRAPRVFECAVAVGADEICRLELGRDREYVPLGAALDAVREETKGYSDRPRRVVELVEKRLRRTKKGGRS